MQHEKIYLILLVCSLFISVAVWIFASKRGRKNKASYKSDNSNILLINTTRKPVQKGKHKVWKRCTIIDIDLSPEISINDWNKLVGLIKDNYSTMDAFVIKTDTDSLPYLSSALSFLIENPRKSVVVTCNDVFGALRLVYQHNLPEICVTHDGLIYRGTRIKKLGEKILSPHCPPVGRTKHGIHLIEKSLRPYEKIQEPTTIYRVQPQEKVVIIKLHPGMKTLGKMIDSNTSGVILEVYGSDHIPLNRTFLQTVKKLVKKGVVVVSVSQYTSLLDDSDVLSELGVINGKDITTEAMLAKLYFLLSNVPPHDREKIRRIIGINMRGEITV